MDDTFSQLEDELLLGHIYEGNHDAFAAIVHRHSKRFYAVAYRIIFNKDDAEDIVQEAFLKLWDKRVLWDKTKEAKFTTWFYRVVVNLCLDHNKKKKPESFLEDMQIEDTQQGQDVLLQKKQQQAMMDQDPEFERIGEPARAVIESRQRLCVSPQRSVGAAESEVRVAQQLAVQARRDCRDVVPHRRRFLSEVIVQSGHLVLQLGVLRRGSDKFQRELQGGVVIPRGSERECG